MKVQRHMLLKLEAPSLYVLMAGDWVWAVDATPRQHSGSSFSRLGVCLSQVGSKQAYGLHRCASFLVFAVIGPSHGLVKSSS